MMKCKHLLGPTIPTSERRVAHVSRSPRTFVYMTPFALIAALQHPADSLSSAPVMDQVIFWTVGFTIFVINYSFWTLVIFRLSLRLGSATMSETLVMFLATAISCSIMLPVALFLGIQPDGLGEMARFFIFCFVLFEVGAYFYLAKVDQVLFPQIYQDPDSKSGHPSGREIMFRGTDLPVAELETISARDNGIEVTGMGRAAYVDRRFGVAVAELPVDLGFQIHRSVWVSFKVAKTFVRQDRHLLVILPDGRRLPVARSRQQEFENWVRLMEQHRATA